MAAFYQDKFDSEILKQDAFKLFLDKEITEARLKHLLNKVNIKNAVIFCFSIFSNQNIKFLDQLGFDFISIRNTYEYGGLFSPPKTKLATGFDVFCSSVKLPELERKSISDLALVIGKTSRYFKDMSISRKSALAVYNQWLANSLYAGYADEYIGINKGNQLVGLVTLKIKNDEGIIDLIGVNDKFQKLGIGTFLLSSALEFFKHQKVKKITIITEGENIIANAFYQKAGFILKDVQLVFHKHC